MLELKQAAARAALAHIKPGMRLGLGTGSTADCFLEVLAARVQEGLDIIGVPTSTATETRCRALGIPLTTLEETPHLDLTVDGADEIDPLLRLIKGGGGALLREKIVAAASERMIVIADHNKQVETLGTFPLPVEIVRFGARSTIELMHDMCVAIGQPATMRLRLDHTQQAGHSFITENGNLIVDCSFGRLDSPDDVADVLQMIPGVVETGLFLDLADLALIAGPTGVATLGPGRKG